MSDWIAEPAAAGLRGELRVPSDKSISHRAVLLAGLAGGTSSIEQPLYSEDVLHTLAAMQALGAQAKRQPQSLEITGCERLQAPAAPIHCGNAGTLIRLLAGAVCGRGIDCILVGDASLSRRPMRRIAEPLSEMGAAIVTSEAGTPPIAIKAVEGLASIEYALPVASAQVKSAVLLAGLCAQNGATVIEPAPCRDHSERMLPAFGAQVSRSGTKVHVQRCRSLRPAQVRIPADPSSAAFFMAAASIVEGSDLLLREVGVNPTRTGALELLRRMGANIETTNPRSIGDEPVADIRVRAAPLRAIEIGGADIPAAIDELPVLLAAAATASGTTVVTGAAELRAKESDRIAAMAALLGSLGIACRERSDGIVVEGGAGRPAAKSIRAAITASRWQPQPWRCAATGKCASATAPTSPPPFRTSRSTRPRPAGRSLRPSPGPARPASSLPHLDRGHHRSEHLELPGRRHKRLVGFVVAHHPDAALRARLAALDHQALVQAHHPDSLPA